jgi:hypothetical protein
MSQLYIPLRNSATFKAYYFYNGPKQHILTEVDVQHTKTAGVSLIDGYWYFKVMEPGSASEHYLDNVPGYVLGFHQPPPTYAEIAARASGKP